MSFFSRPPEGHCYCGQSGSFSQCCEPLLTKEQFANAPEQLMRSRFSAFCTNNGQYLLATHHPDTRGDLTSQTLSHAARQTRWLKLEVLASEGLSLSADQVYFRAWFVRDSCLEYHQELSDFRELEGRWYYLSGLLSAMDKSKIMTIGRNDPCPCGSLMKYKKCCLSRKMS